MTHSHDMPKRPVQHALATGSSKAFVDALPNAWTCQARDDDYGVDFDVEIFEHGAATGLRFCVQLKSTQNLRGKAPSCRVKWTTRSYWGAQGQPLLVVLWEAETGTLWWRWSHHFDTYGIADSGEEFTFKFEPAQAWDGETVERIATEVKAWRAWEAAAAHLPLSVTVAGDGDIAGVPIGQIVVRLRQLLREFRETVQVKGVPTGELHISVQLTSTITSVWLSGGPSNNLHHEAIEPVAAEHRDAFLDGFAADIVVLIAHHLSRMHLLGPAARMAANAAAAASAVLSPGVGLDLIPLLVDHDHLDAALLIVGRVHERADDATSTVMTRALTSACNDDKSRTRVRDALRRGSAGIAAAGDPVRAASTLYNSSRLYNLTEGRRVLGEVAELDPSYRQRGYWWRERGGGAFLTGDFATAVDDYETAVKLGDGQSTVLLADALLFAGRYADAVTQFAAALQSDGWSTPEWRLKRRLTPILIDRTGIETQTRDVDAAQANAGASLTCIEWEAALRADMLCGEALYHLAEAERAEDKPFYSLAIMSALVEPANPIAWLGALRAAAFEGDDQLFEDVAMCARRFCEDEILDLLLEDPETSTLAQFVAGVFENLPPEPSEPDVIRVVADDGSVTEIDMTQPARP